MQNKFMKPVLNNNLPTRRRSNLEYQEDDDQVFFAKSNDSYRQQNRSPQILPNKFDYTGNARSPPASVSNRGIIKRLEDEIDDLNANKNVEEDFSYRADDPYNQREVMREITARQIRTIQKNQISEISVIKKPYVIANDF